MLGMTYQSDGWLAIVRMRRLPCFTQRAKGVADEQPQRD
jgi:hypothetical protein